MFTKAMPLSLWVFPSAFGLTAGKAFFPQLVRWVTIKPFSVKLKQCIPGDGAGKGYIFY